MAGDTPYERHRVLLWMGVVALVVACVCLYQVVVTQSPQAEETDASSPAKTPSFVGQVARGWALAVQVAWFRRFLVSRIFFLSVELAMPFYTIHETVDWIRKLHHASGRIRNL